jgi:hypothetical protein
MPNSVGLNGTGKPEPVFTEGQWEVMKSLVSSGVSSKIGSSDIASGGGREYNLTIDMRGSTISSTVDMEQAVAAALDKIDSRMGVSRTIGS